MFKYKKPEPAIYHSEATGAEFKFRHSNDNEREALEFFVRVEENGNNRNNLRVLWAKERTNCYAAWLLEDFSGVEDENGKSHVSRDFSFEAKVGLIQTLRQTDSEFITWFEAHCEPMEKKIKEAAPAERVVGAAELPNVQV